MSDIDAELLNLARGLSISDNKEVLRLTEQAMNGDSSASEKLLQAYWSASYQGKAIPSGLENYAAYCIFKIAVLKVPARKAFPLVNPTRGRKKDGDQDSRVRTRGAAVAYAHFVLGLPLTIDSKSENAFDWASQHQTKNGDAIGADACKKAWGQHKTLWQEERPDLPANARDETLNNLIKK